MENSRMEMTCCAAGPAMTLCSAVADKMSSTEALAMIMWTAELATIWPLEGRVMTWSGEDSVMTFCTETMVSISFTERPETTKYLATRGPQDLWARWMSFRRY